MVETERKKPTLEELKEIINSRETTGRFNLTPRVDLAIRQSEAEEDSEIALRELADDVFKREKENHPELTTNRQRMRFIQKDTFKWTNSKLALHLGLSEDEIRHFDRKGMRERELNKFRRQFEGLFSIASVLSRMVDEVIDRRGALVNPNGLLSDLGVGEIIKTGEIDKAVAITEKTFQHVQSANYLG